jgi:FAD/FMN-containing dehydrogenase
MAAIQIDQLRSTIRGTIVLPGDSAYESARKVYNGMIDKRPAIIVRCVDVADVIAAVDYGRTNNLLIAIRGGGHSGAGLGTCDGGLVIDLSPMKGVRVDAAARTVRVGAGCVWGDVDHATHPFGLAVPDWLHLEYRRRRPHARRRHRLSHPPIRPHDRQPAVR